MRLPLDVDFEVVDHEAIDGEEGAEKVEVVDGFDDPEFEVEMSFEDIGKFDVGRLTPGWEVLVEELGVFCDGRFKITVFVIGKAEHEGDAEDGSDDGAFTNHVIDETLINEDDFVRVDVDEKKEHEIVEDFGRVRKVSISSSGWPHV